MPNSSLAALCVPGTFGTPSLFGIQTVAVAASVANVNLTVPTNTLSQPMRHVKTSFCNVTVSYTHPGQNDLISVEAWLPSPEKWNKVFMATGGSGLSMGRNEGTYSTLSIPAIADGYATATTDAGVGGVADPWAFLSPGNMDQVKMHNAAARHLEEQGLLSRQLVQSMYGRPAQYSYFKGCSQGGRQGLQVSQRYPDLYDGIMAAAPVLSLGILGGIHWTQQYMVNSGEVPHECELSAIYKATTAFCDELDGVADGIVSDPAACLAKFDPFSVVGTTVPCADAAGGQIAVSTGAAGAVNASWHGPKYSASGKQIWPGFNPGADLVVSGFSVANTDCSSGTCVGRPWPIAEVGFKAILARDPSINLANMTNAEFERLVRFGEWELQSWDVAKPDLTDLQGAGTKMLTYHGMADDILPPASTLQFYERVAQVSPDVHSFYRLFEVPGLAHCAGGRSGTPADLFNQLRAWVENGTAPASTAHEVINSVTGKIDQRLACPFPQKPQLDTACGDAGREECWSCPSV